MNVAPPAFPSLSPIGARLLNAVSRRDLPWTFSLRGGPCGLDMAGPADDTPFEVVCRLDVLVGGAAWRADLGSPAPLGLHPALAENPDGEALYDDLPEALRQAVLEDVFQPLLDMASAWMGTSVRFAARSEDTIDGGAPAAENLFLMLTVPSPVGPRAVPLRLSCADPDSLRFVAERLESLPVRRAPRPDVPVVCAVEAGSLSLSPGELRALEEGDVLLPDTWHPEAPWLRLPDGSVFACRAADGRAEILGPAPLDASDPDGPERIADANHHEENVMSQTDEVSPAEESGAETASDASPVSGVDVDSLEVAVRFELERLTLTVGELSSLAPGYVFALGGDPAAPVTVRAGGVAVAEGRLVDVGGVPGVQILRLTPASRGVAASAALSPDISSPPPAADGPEPEV